jgi:hypothetical protein
LKDGITMDLQGDRGTRGTHWLDTLRTFVEHQQQLLRTDRASTNRVYCIFKGCTKTTLDHKDMKFVIINSMNLKITTIFTYTLIRDVRMSPMIRCCIDCVFMFGQRGLRKLYTMYRHMFHNAAFEEIASLMTNHRCIVLYNGSMNSGIEHTVFFYEGDGVVCR